LNFEVPGVGGRCIKSQITEDSEEPEVKFSEPRSSTDNRRFGIELNDKKHPIERAKCSASKLVSERKRALSQLCLMLSLGDEPYWRMTLGLKSLSFLWFIVNLAPREMQV
jgi:hypothetical protein